MEECLRHPVLWGASRGVDRKQIASFFGESGGVEVAQEQGREEDGENEVEDEEERVADDKRGEDHLVAVCVEGVEWDGEG